MRVAHLVSTFPPYRGGIGNVAYQTARELTLLGIENEIFTPDYNGKGESGDHETGFKVHRLSPWFKYGNAALLPQLLFRLSSFDLIHLHFPFFGGSEWLLLLNWIFVRTPKIVMSYHMDVVGAGLLKPFFNGYGKTILPLLVKRSDGVIFATREYGETSLIASFLKEKPVYHIPYGVPLRFHPKAKNRNLMSRLELTDRNKVVLFVGGLDRAHYFKGVSHLISAVSSLKMEEVKVILVGNGDLIPQFRKEVKKEGLENQVVFSEGVGDDELPDYYNLADLAVLPSIDRSEAFGIVLLEAMACARPVIASSLPGVSALINDHHDGLLTVPGNAGDLAEKIHFLLTRPELREEYGLNGFKKVEDNFRWGPLIQKVKGVYQDLLKQRG
jgi:glycosyltransferase involved in cell wall biosynthesis